MAPGQQCHGILLSCTAATAQNLLSTLEGILTSPHTICSPLPPVCLCLLFKPGSWWWQGFGGVGFDGLLQWGVS